MANTYTQLYIQFVFAVKYRTSLIHSSWEQQLYRYITGIVQNHKHKLIAINGMPDHLHLFVGMHPAQSSSSLMQSVKGESAEWINTRGFVPGKFHWQQGFGGFSYGHSQIGEVYDYIMNQKNHHSRISFLDEYKAFLDHFCISYEDRYIFKETTPD